METAFEIFTLLFGLLILAAYSLWAVRDATRRNKSAVLVLIAVVFFFPFGLVAWLLFRPPVSRPGLARTVYNR
jgi:hypothetical protein